MNILCADIGATSVKAGIVTGAGKLQNLQETATESCRGGPHVVANLGRLLRQYDDFQAIGISSSGQVDAGRGRIRYANENMPDYTGTELKQIFEQQFSVPVAVENDVNCAALGEVHFGAGREVDSLVCLTYGTGIGGAIIVDRSLYRGADGAAGEFGHIITHPGGRPCACGGSGCYERYASTSALLEAVQEEEPACRSGRQLFERIGQGDILLRALVDRWALEVALGLAGIIHIFNPPLVILGGGVLEQDLAFRAIEERTRQLVMGSFQGLKLVPAALGNTAGLFGAASLHAAAG